MSGILSEKSNEGTLAALKKLLEERAILRGQFTLSSGQKSAYYFDGRRVTLWPEGAYLVGKALFEMLKETVVKAVGGPTLGADPIVAAVAVVSHQEGHPLPAFIVRREAKGHGTQQAIEGCLPPPGSPVALVDDVITTGGNLFHAIEAVEAAGCRVARVAVLVDRQQGGAEELRRRGYSFSALFTATPRGDLVAASSGGA
ncbi:MAG: orotate phosphoribosyltransferase [Chloroflexi bacterium]|nr:orotate phosphoribosyltransferase [Chloroflexota bacterium]